MRVRLLAQCYGGQGLGLAQGFALSVALAWVFALCLGLPGGLRRYLLRAKGKMALRLRELFPGRLLVSVLARLSRCFRSWFCVTVASFCSQGAQAIETKHGAPFLITGVRTVRPSPTKHCA